MVIGLRSSVQTIWCPLPPKNSDIMLPAAVRTGHACCRCRALGLAKKLATHIVDSEKMERDDLHNGISVPC